MGTTTSREDESGVRNHHTSNNHSSQSQQPDKVCEHCDATKHQKDIPDADTESSNGGLCENYYMNVTICMKQNKGQITSCRKEWDLFRDCHENSKQQQQQQQEKS